MKYIDGFDAEPAANDTLVNEVITPTLDGDASTHWALSAS
jgi:hypothetical protein